MNFEDPGIDLALYIADDFNDAIGNWEGTLPTTPVPNDNGPDEFENGPEASEFANYIRSSLDGKLRNIREDPISFDSGPNSDMQYMLQEPVYTPANIDNGEHHDQPVPFVCDATSDGEKKHDPSPRRKWETQDGRRRKATTSTGTSPYCKHNIAGPKLCYEKSTRALTSISRPSLSI